MESLEGKLVVVAGGSSGIGLSLVELARSLDADVIFTYRNHENEAKELSKKTGAKAVKFELGNQDSTKHLMNYFERPIDYFISSAGTEHSGALKKQEWDKIDQVTVKLNGNLYLMQGLVSQRKGKTKDNEGTPYLSPGAQYTIIGSATSEGFKDLIPYVAVNAGLKAISKVAGLDEDIKKQEIGFLVVEPAFVRTPLAERGLKVLEYGIARNHGEEMLKEFKESGLVMTPEYAAQQILMMTVNPSIVGSRTIPENLDFSAAVIKYA